MWHARRTVVVAQWRDVRSLAEECFALLVSGAPSTTPRAGYSRSYRPAQGRAEDVEYPLSLRATHCLSNATYEHLDAEEATSVKLTCNQQELAKGLSTVSHAVSSRTTLPILSHILLKAEGDAIRLAATNLEIGITVR